MTPAEMGLVYNQLVSQRTIYSGKISNRRRSKEEAEAAEILDKTRGDHADLDDFLETQGLVLVKVDPFAIGLGMQGSIYVALRNPAVVAPAHLTPNDVLQELIDERRRSENKDSAAIWASFLLLTLFYFLYTREGRSIESVSEFKDSAVDQEEFIEEISKLPEDLELNEKWSQLLKIRDVCNLSIEEKRASKEIGSSLEAAITIKINKQKLKILEGVDFAELCITSLAEIKFHDTDEIDVQTNKAQGNKCPVCWKISEEPCQRHGH